MVSRAEKTYESIQFPWTVQSIKTAWER